MPHPTKVTTIHPHSLTLKLGQGVDAESFLKLGFLPDDYYERVLAYESPEPEKIYMMIETLRDRGVPFSTHRQIGADEIVSMYRDKGVIGGQFKRLRKMGLDWDDNAPFVIESF
jgi:hypothetical protein